MAMKRREMRSVKWKTLHEDQPCGRGWTPKAVTGSPSLGIVRLCSPFGWGEGGKFKVQGQVTDPPPSAFASDAMADRHVGGYSYKRRSSACARLCPLMPGGGGRTNTRRQ